MDLSDKIRSAEGSMKDRLESYFISVYPSDRLFSHGLDHHRRVWEYAKELLRYMEEDGFIFELSFIQKLIMACYLHDIGMATDTSEKHGRHSRELCIKFLRENNLKESHHTDLLSAIENHDNKDYPDTRDQDLLLKILSVADDLDAFGEEGISRYLEIYTERGIEKRSIGKAVRDNARIRFENFGKIFRNHPELVERQKKRYLLLDNYFKKTSTTE